MVMVSNFVITVAPKVYLQLLITKLRFKVECVGIELAERGRRTEVSHK